MDLIPVFKAGVWNAWIFMSVFILQMIIMMLADENIRKKSHVPQEAKQSRREKNAGVIANLVWLAAIVYSVFLPFKLNTIWFYSGLILFIIGLILMAIATYDFISTPSDQLITKGIYRLSRNPMYLATFFICLGTGIASASWIFIIISIIMTLCFHQEIIVEERFCQNEYGDAYREYSERIPRWLG